MRSKSQRDTDVSLHWEDQSELLQRDPNPPAGRQVQCEGLAQGGAGLHVA